MTAIVEATNLKKVFEPDIVALEAFDLEIEAGDFVAIIGPSGCGKTTFMRMVAGFETVTAGSLLFEGNPVQGPDYTRGVVFQDIRLFPFLTIKDNLRYGMATRGVNSGKLEKTFEEIVDKFHLKEFLSFYPHEVSLGTQQKVGMARILANDPDLIMCDEPFNSLDWRTREELQRSILELWLEKGKTIIYVTHNVREAVYLAKRVVVCTVRPGRVKEIVEVDLPDARWEAEVRLGQRFLDLVHQTADSLKDEVIKGRELESLVGY
jgi:NitT/TauT family transport system ATP-binding protein